MALVSKKTVFFLDAGREFRSLSLHIITAQLNKNYTLKQWKYSRNINATSWRHKGVRSSSLKKWLWSKHEIDVNLTNMSENISDLTGAWTKRLSAATYVPLFRKPSIYLEWTMSNTSGCFWIDPTTSKETQKYLITGSCVL